MRPPLPALRRGLPLYPNKVRVGNFFYYLSPERKQSTAGVWTTADKRFAILRTDVLLRSGEGVISAAGQWRVSVMPFPLRPAEPGHPIERALPGITHRTYPTRREALETLALALDIEANA